MFPEMRGKRLGKKEGGRASWHIPPGSIMKDNSKGREKKVILQNYIGFLFFKSVREKLSALSVHKSEQIRQALACFSPEQITWYARYGTCQDE